MGLIRREYLAAPCRLEDARGETISLRDWERVAPSSPWKWKCCTTTGVDVFPRVASEGSLRVKVFAFLRGGHGVKSSNLVRFGADR